MKYIKCLIIPNPVLSHKLLAIPMIIIGIIIFIIMTSASLVGYSYVLSNYVYIGTQYDFLKLNEDTYFWIIFLKSLVYGCIYNLAIFIYIGSPCTYVSLFFIGEHDGGVNKNIIMIIVDVILVTIITLVMSNLFIGLNIPYWAYIITMIFLPGLLHIICLAINVGFSLVM
jgi:hypothetical protein